MKRVMKFLVIFLGAALIFAAAELLPVIVSHYDDRDRCERIILEEDVAAAGKIAYELSWEDKLRLLANTEGAVEKSVFTKVYETRSRDNLNTYDTAVLSAFETCMEAMQNMELLSLPVNLEDRLSDACCISVDSGQNGIGALTLWVLTFHENEREWQFLLDVREEKLYGMYMQDRRSSDTSQEETKEAVETEKVFQENEGRFVPWGNESLPLYFGGSGYDGYGMWVREANTEQDTVYIPMRAEEYYEDKEKIYTTCYMLGDDIFYQRLSEAMDDLHFAEFCVFTETLEEPAMETEKK